MVILASGCLLGLSTACTQTAARTEANAKRADENIALTSIQNKPDEALTVQQDKRVSYSVGRVIRNSNEPHEVTVIVSTDPQHFNRDDMVRLASHLKNDFPNAPILWGEILDDRNIAENYVPAGDMHRFFYKARRAFYSLNRKSGAEYVEFSTARGRPINQVKIDLTKKQGGLSKDTNRSTDTNGAKREPATLLSVTQPASRTEESPRVPFCDLLTNPRLYRGRVVRTEAIALSTFEFAMFYSTACTKEQTLTSLKPATAQITDELDRILGSPLTGPKRITLTVEGYLNGPNRNGYDHLNFARFEFRPTKILSSAPVDPSTPYPAELLKLAKRR